MQEVKNIANEHCLGDPNRSKTVDNVKEIISIWISNSIRGREHAHCPILAPPSMKRFHNLSSIYFLSYCTFSL